MPGGFTVDDFTVNVEAGTVTCPNGVTRPINRVRQVNFGVACRGCPLREQCTTAVGGRSLHLSEHEPLMRAARRHADTEAFQQPYRQQRPMVERSIAWLVRGGNRKVRYRGIAKNNQWLHHRVTGLNLRRMLALGLQPSAHRLGHRLRPRQGRPSAPDRRARTSHHLPSHRLDTAQPATRAGPTRRDQHTHARSRWPNKPLLQDSPSGARRRRWVMGRLGMGGELDAAIGPRQRARGRTGG